MKAFEIRGVLYSLAKHSLMIRNFSIRVELRFSKFYPRFLILNFHKKFLTLSGNKKFLAITGQIFVEKVKNSYTPKVFS